ncbi:MAG: FtsX-like permease family protein [Bryobacterales bacterium]|nr:FtsX-like permease family protein [Bryobacterales bacterium]
MMLLRLLTLPYVRKHLLRTGLTIAGVALGVLVFVGMRTANDSVLYGFQQTVDRIAGKAQLQITSGEGGFPEEVLERVQAMEEINIAVPVIEAQVKTGLQGQGNILILAVDMTGDRSLRSYDIEEGEDAVVDDPLVFLAQPDSIILTREFAQQNNLSVGSKVSFDTMVGPKSFTVRGIMKPGGLASAFGGNLAVMDIYAAQHVFGRGRSFDRIDLTLKEGIALDQGRQAIEKLLGAGYQVEAPSQRGKQFETISKLFAVAASLNSLFALLIGLFIIYNTFSIAVAQRRSEIGIARALGATRAQIRNLFLLESALLGLTGSLTGIAGGLIMAKGMASYIGQFLGDLYGVAQHTEGLALNPQTLLLAVGVGVLTSMVAAWIPARDAARIDPVKALHKGSYESITASENRWRLVTATAFVGIAAFCLVTGGTSGPKLYVGYFSVVAASVLATPILVRALILGLRPLLRLVLPVEGALAADSLMQSPRRTSATVAAVMLSLSLVVGLGGIADASYASILDWVESVVNPDLFVGTNEQISERSFRFPASLGDEIRKLDLVDEVQTVRSTRVNYRGTPVMLVAIPMLQVQGRIKPKVVAGPANVFEAAAKEGGVVLGDNLALLQNLNVGDMMEISSPSGVLRLPITGIAIDYTDQLGAILIDRSLYLKHWKDETANLFRVYLKKGVTPEAGKQQILMRFGSQNRLFVMTNRQLRDYIVKVTDQWFGLTYMQIFVAVLVATLGIVNSLTVSITDRRRELGVLQAVGGLRRQVRQAIWMEAAGIGLVSVILGLALGGLILYYYLGIIREDMAGIRLEYVYPVKIALLLAPTMLAVSWLSALGPGESAVRASLVEALEYE